MKLRDVKIAEGTGTYRASIIACDVIEYDLSDDISSNKIVTGANASSEEGWIESNILEFSNAQTKRKSQGDVNLGVLT